MQSALRAVRRNRIRTFLREACRLVMPMSRTSASSHDRFSMGLEGLENRQMLSISVVGNFVAGQKSGIAPSSTDIINGLVPTSSTYAAQFEGGPIANLNDGKTAADPAQLDEATAAGNAVFNPGQQFSVTYTLPYQPNGWTITEIDSIAGHSDNRTNQYFEIYYRTQNDFWGINLSPDNNGFTYAPNRGNGASKVSLTDTRGHLISGVVEITFMSRGADDAGTVQTGALGQGPVFRELDVFGTPTVAPTAPQNVKTTAGPAAARLSWDRVAGADSYEVMRSDTGRDGYYMSLWGSKVTDPAFTDTMLNNGTTYWYKIVATNGAGTAESAPVSVTPKEMAPLAPQNVKTAGGLGKITVKWDIEPFTDSYVVYRSSTQNGSFTPVAQTVTGNSWVDTNVGNTGSTYYYKVASTSTYGTGAPSAAVAGTAGVVGSGTGLVGMYYDDGGQRIAGSNPAVVDPARLFTGAVVVRSDANVNFNWGNNAPMAGMGADQFTVKWIGKVLAPVTDKYTFYTLSDDGAFLFVNGQKVVDDPTYHGATAGTDDKSSETLFPGGIQLEAGKMYDIEMWSFEDGGGAAAILSWETAGLGRMVIPQSQLYHAAPAATTVSAVEGPAQVKLSWTATTGVTYTIRRGTTQDNLKDIATGVSGLSYTDTPLVNGTTYYYQVVAVNDAGSAPSAVISATPHLVAPAAPAAPTVSVTPATGGGQLNISWAAVDFADSYDVYRSSTSGGTFTMVNTAPVTGTSFVDNGLTPATTYYYKIKAANTTGASDFSPEGSGATNNLPTGWSQADIGNTGIAGSADYDPATGTYTIRGSGGDIWDGGDNFHYLYMPLTSEATVTARITGLYNPSAPTDPNQIDGWSKANVMIRKSLTANSMYAYAGMSYGNGMNFQSRASDSANNSRGDSTGGGDTRLRDPYWVRLHRERNDFWMEISPDGVHWLNRTPIRQSGMGTDVYVGFAVTAHNNGRLSEAKFDNLTIEQVITAPLFGLTSVSNTGASFGWASDPFAASYTIERSTTSTFDAGTITSFSLAGDATSWSDTPGSGSFYYRARKTTAKGENSAWSGIIGVDTKNRASRVIGQGLSARQWNNTGRTGDPALVRLEDEVSLRWGDGNNETLGSLGWRQINNNIARDNFGTRFTGRVQAPETGTYTFLSRTDDDGYVWVNGQLVSADPGGHGERDPNPTTQANNVLTPIQLQAGEWYDIVMQQQEGGGGAGAQLEWIRPDGSRQTVPSMYLNASMAAPAAPTALTVTSTGLGGYVGLSFTDNSYTENGFVVERANNPQFTGALSFTVPGNWQNVVNNAVTTSDAPILPGTTYYYRVKAVNYDASSTWSDTATVTTVASLSLSGQGAAGHYYNYSNGNEPLTAPVGPAYAQVDATIDFTSNANPQPGQGTTWTPFPNQGNANFSVVWTGKVLADAAGSYTFVTNSDDANYLWVDGKLVSSDPGGHGERDTGLQADGTTTYGTRTPIQLSAGWHNFVYLMANGGGGYGAHLKWITPGQATAAAIPSDHLDATSDIPAAATNIVKRGLTTKKVSLTWTDNAINETAYMVIRATDAAFTQNVVTVAQIGAGAGTGTSLTVVDNGLSASTTYYYRVAAVNFDGASYAETTVTTPAVDVLPNAPTGLAAIGRTGGKVRLTWTDASENEEKFLIERATSENGPWTEIASVLEDTTSYTDASKDLVVGNTYYYRVRAWNVVGNSAYTTAASATTVTSSLPAPWQAADIGPNVGTNPVIGDANYANGTFEVTGNGDDVWNAADAFRYTYQSLDADGSITARVTGFQNTNDWAKIGVMIRGGLTADAPHAFLAMTPQNFVAFQGRVSKGAGSVEFDSDPGAANNSHVNATMPVWVRLTRTNNVIKAELSQTGQAGSWTQVSTEQTVNLGSTVYVGLAVTSHAQGVLNTSFFDNVTVTKVATNVKAAKPTGVVATTGNGEGMVAVTWTDNNAAETGYKVFRSTNPSSGFVEVATVGPNIASFVDRGLSTSGTYYYKVQALNNRAAGLDSDMSDASQGAMPGTYPAYIRINSFDNLSGVQVNGAAQIVTLENGKGVLRVVPATNDLQGSAFVAEAKDISVFTADFDFQTTLSTGADGFAFVLLGTNNPTGLSALGPGGGALGYANTTTFANSIAVKFDIYPSVSTTGLYFNGEDVGENAKAIDMRPRGVEVGSGHVMHVTLAYNGTTLTEIVKDTETGATFRADYVVDIPGIIGASTGYVGFTSANGGAHAQQDILNLNYAFNYVQPPQNVVVNGTENADSIYVKRVGNDIKVWFNATGTGTAAQTLPLDKTQSLTINGLGGADYIVLDSSGGSLLPADGIKVDGGADSAVINVRGLAATTDLTVDNTQVQYGTGSYSYANASIELGKRNAEIGTTPSVIDLKSLSINGTAKVALAAAGVDGAGQSKDQVLVVSGLNIATGAQLDVADNSIILKHTDGDYGVTRTGNLMAKVNSGRTGGTNAWEGAGIISSSAKANELGITTVGVMNNDVGENTPFKTEYYGVPVDASVIILKYTYFGDTDLDGEITGSDYAITDLSYWLQTENPGWRGGDNNGDGVVDGSDYAVMDLAFWLQEAGKPLGGELFDEPIVANGAANAFAQDATAIGSEVKQDDTGSFLTDDIAVLA